ncbi:MAG: ABC transporter ATP-binding protein [Phycisphaerae bacterium]|nr:ABC transporter ATP-binding protein [Phycisphaerae bacterium]
MSNDAILVAKNLHKTYPLGRTELQVLRGVSMSVKRGEFVAIMGSSGSGKSTLMHILGALDVPQKGQVTFDGQDLFEAEDVRAIPVIERESADRSAFSARLRGGPLEPFRNRLRNAAFGFVFQFYHLLPELDVIENILLPCMVGETVANWFGRRRDLTERAHQTAESLGLTNRLRHKPNELSGGERQRVAIARALINRPRVLLADEPTGNLDARTGREILGLLKDLNRQGQTMVMVTHDAWVAEQADRTVQIADGRIKSAPSD